MPHKGCSVFASGSVGRRSRETTKRSVADYKLIIPIDSLPPSLPLSLFIIHCRRSVDDSSSTSRRVPTTRGVASRRITSPSISFFALSRHVYPREESRFPRDSSPRSSRSRHSGHVVARNRDRRRSSLFRIIDHGDSGLKGAPR